jgi:cystathionine beta-lyase/cystathionine gamma-synthase
MDEVLRFDTLATHAGAEFSSPAAQLEARISALEGAGLGSARAWGLAFASGRAALDAVARLLRPNDRVIASNEVSGAAFRALAMLPEFGVTVEFCDLLEPEGVDFEGASAVFLEALSSASLGVPDISRIASLAHTAGALVIVENSLATAYSCRPLEFGADVIVYSSVAMLVGDSALSLGLVVGRNDAIFERTRNNRELIGTRAPAQVCAQALRGLRGLGVRFERQNKTVFELLEKLGQNSHIRELLVPAASEASEFQLLSRDGRELPGGVFSLRFHNLEATRAAMESLKIFERSEFVGDGLASFCQPSNSSHRALEAHGLEPDPRIVRFAVGLEDAGDLWRDLERMLSAIAPFTPEPEPEPEIPEPDEPEGPAKAFDPALEPLVKGMSADEVRAFARLRDWRNLSAEKLEVSGFMIASNAILANIAKANPATLEALAEVKGIGPERLKRYGATMLEVLGDPDALERLFPQTSEVEAEPETKTLNLVSSQPKPFDRKKRRRKRPKPTTS